MESLPVSEIERANFGFELWTPARIAEPRLVMGYEVIRRGDLFALTSEIYSPGPFDTFEDVILVIARKMRDLQKDLVNDTGGSSS